MRHTFVAFNVPILNFSHEPDSVNSIIPPEAHAIFTESIPMTYGADHREMSIGFARLKRLGNQLLADMTIYSGMKDKQRALKMMKKLYPATSFNILQAHDNVILELKIVEVFLSPWGNQDINIQPLGVRVKIKTNPKDMH